MTKKILSLSVALAISLSIFAQCTVSYLIKTNNTNDVTKGKQWVTDNPNDINKTLPETSIQFISIQFESNTKNADLLTAKMIKDFRTNFDFEKLKAMLEK